MTDVTGGPLVLRPGARPSSPQEALVHLCAYGPQGSRGLGFDLAEDGAPLGHAACERRGAALLSTLGGAGLVVPSWRGRYALTERGRIAAALVMSVHPGMREAFFE